MLSEWNPIHLTKTKQTTWRGRDSVEKGIVADCKDGNQPGKVIPTNKLYGRKKFHTWQEQIIGQRSYHRNTSCWVNG